MNISSMTIKGFRCFDDTGQTIPLDHLSCFVGPNGSGKTAAMLALSRLFGDSRAERQIVPSDFHLGEGEKLKDKPSRQLMIECRLDFPELDEGGEGTGNAVPETFNQMVVDALGETPYCRIRLEATWTDDGTATGDVEPAISWILTTSDDPTVIDDGNRRKVLPGDRAKIRVVYVPAARDPDHQIRTTTATTFGRLLQSLALEGADEELRVNIAAVRDNLADLCGVKTMNSEVQGTWKRFYDGKIARDVLFQALEEDPCSLVKLLIPVFRPSADGRELLTGDLSDGLRSLFSLSLSLGLFRVEELIRDKAATSGFKPSVASSLPILTVFAVEEPENHLSPHYLGRVVAELLTIASDKRAQVLVSSHSPSILGRVAPDHVRYFRGHEHSTATVVKPIPLPTDVNDEAFKYVREAVRGYPELYFSRLVVLGEGASEEIVLKRFFEASGTPLDSHFISVVPLGGRHVNHFWRLLHGLDIPYLTLLDLDREKEGAGWGRIQYVRNQLVARYSEEPKKLEFKVDGGGKRSLADSAYDGLADKATDDLKTMQSYLDFYEERFNVFFSTPLDLDFALLEKFTAVYKGLAPTAGGPRLPKTDSPKYNEAVIKRMRQVLSSDDETADANLGSTYSDPQKALFAWYKYLFVDGSKPVAHMRALLAIPQKDLAEQSPKFLVDLLEKAREILSAEVE
ncbi:AAA family ATPase [Geobacter sulfurreducens subsp. ethanolicus]|uniref:ATP-dependent nuclease n=1 Tax=Geobacter sulfurreducens TaxID=35554 RepID=UPI002572C44B|nr:AAA family ATPase [Geobacter sulfurreducens]BEH09870.1 AAA family ATPase [Geobacter sulfurreducens subsp. ethanolicus]